MASSFATIYYPALIQKTYQCIYVVNAVSRSHKKANIFFSFDSAECIYTKSTRRHYKAIHLIIIPIENSLETY